MSIGTEEDAVTCIILAKVRPRSLLFQCFPPVCCRSSPIEMLTTLSLWNLSLWNPLLFRTVLGTGSFGVVRLVHHKLSGTKTAVKTYDKRKIKDSAQLKRVQQEIRLMARANHPNIVRRCGRWCVDVCVVVPFCSATRNPTEVTEP